MFVIVFPIPVFRITNAVIVIKLLLLVLVDCGCLSLFVVVLSWLFWLSLSSSRYVIVFRCKGSQVAQRGGMGAATERVESPKKEENRRTKGVREGEEERI